MRVEWGAGYLAVHSDRPMTVMLQELTVLQGMDVQQRSARLEDSVSRRTFTQLCFLFFRGVVTMRKRYRHISIHLLQLSWYV